MSVSSCPAWEMSIIREVVKETKLALSKAVKTILPTPPHTPRIRRVNGAVDPDNPTRALSDSIVELLPSPQSFTSNGVFGKSGCGIDYIRSLEALQVCEVCLTLPLVLPTGVHSPQLACSTQSSLRLLVCFPNVPMRFLLSLTSRHMLGYRSFPRATPFILPLYRLPLIYVSCM